MYMPHTNTAESTMAREGKLGQLNSWEDYCWISEGEQWGDFAN